MNRGIGMLWLGIAIVAVLAAAWLLVADDDPIQTVSPVISRMNPTVPGETNPVLTTTREGAKLQQMIDSGQLAPPPGNPDKMFSIASPFSDHAQTPETATTARVVAGNDPLLPDAPLIGAKHLAAPGDQTAAPPDRPNAQPASTAVQAATPPMDFETPPGIGSATGGK